MAREAGSLNGMSRKTWIAVGAVVVLLGVGVGAVAKRAGSGAAGPVDVSTPRAAPGTDRASSAAPERADRAERDGAAVPHGSPGVGSSPAAGEADAASAEAESEPERTPVVWAEPTEPSPVEPVPMEARVPKPEAVRGIYVGAWSVGSPGRLEQLIALADETEINAFVIDVKDVTGEVSHASRVPLARQIGATPQVKIADLRGTLARLREHGIYPIARIVVFKDPLLATARPEWAIERDDGTIWEDNTGVPWVDSYNRNVWEYNIELAREAVALGFSEIQWDYIRFPDVPGSYLVEAVYPAQEGRSKTAAIREFMAYTRERLADLEVPVTADVFGITTSTRLDIGIGQVWEEMSDVVDVLLPMVYPSHYPDGSWEYENPNAAPYQIVKRAMDDAVARSLLIDGAAAIRPWLQAFSMGEPAYGPRHVRAQIDAVYDAGLREWILWSPGVRYNREALASESGVEPWFAGMGELLYEEGLPSGPAVDEPLGSPADTVGSGR